jgi:hypothetical protein
MTETTESFRPALYYPYIHIRSEDWLKATLLCVPVVKRLIPENYDPEDTGDIAPYAKIAGPYGELLQRVPAYSAAADQAQQELFSKIRDDLDTIKEAYGRAKAPPVDEYWIHDAKFSGSLLGYLEDEGLAWKSADPNAYGQRNWYALHPILGKAVMTCIGLSTARDSDLDIVTADGKYHEALLTTDEDDIFDALLRQRRLQKLTADSEARRDLGQLVIAFAGINLKALPPDRIPELQASKRFAAFGNLLRRSASTIDKNTDEATYNRELKAEAEEIVDAWRDAVNETSKDLREAVFESVVLGSEVVKTLVKGPEVYELIAVGGLGLWRVGDKVKRYVERRQKSNHFLSQISNAESEVLRLQFPLGL